jgi:GNAT superfamily N-acetyltransferase
MRPGPVIIDPETRASGLTGLWNAAAGREFPLDERLFVQQLRLDTDPRRCFAFVEPDGTILAAALVKRAARTGPSGEVPSTGYLSWLVVDGHRRRQGLATSMMKAAKAWLSSLGVSNLRFGSDYYHLLPGRPMEQGAGYEALGAFLGKQGFTGEAEEYDLMASLASGAGPAEEPDGAGGRFEYRLFRPEERSAVIAFMHRNFPGRWTHEVTEAMAAGMRPADLMLAIDTADGTVVGFSRLYDDSSPVLGPGVYWRGLMGRNPGGLGPIGIDASRRGAGLGYGLLVHCKRELRARGIDTMVIDWTDLINFYGKSGFKVWKRYEPMSAPL